MATKSKRSPAGYVLIALSLIFFLGSVGAVAWLYLIPHPGEGPYKCQQIGDREVCQGKSRLTVRH
ncbi:MAG: hypothetical protein ACREE0_19050 [Phenylobacterium sp.]